MWYNKNILDNNIIILGNFLFTLEMLMKLTKIKIQNYRCFEKEQIIEFDDLTAFIGNNCSGKTTAMSALNCIFSNNSNDRILKRSDFHLPHDKSWNSLDRQELYIEAVFVFDEL